MLLAHVRNRTHDARIASVASTLVSLHVAAYAESLAATVVWAPEGLLARVRMAVDLEAGGPGEGFVARWADVALLSLRKSRVC